MAHGTKPGAVWKFVKMGYWDNDIVPNGRDDEREINKDEPGP